MPKKALVLSLLLSLFLAGAAQAAEFVKPDKDSGNTLLPATETHRNLYTAGGSVTINSTTNGDLAVAGGMVNLVGNVEQDVMAAGGTLELSGTVGGDARLGGGNITVNGPVGGDALIAGGNVNIGSQSSIAGDFVAGAGNLTLNAPVRGSVRAAGGNIVINSRVEGNVNVQSDQTLTFGPNAEVLGQVFHKGPKQAVVQEGARVGNIQYTEVKAGDRNGKARAGLASAGFLIQILAWIAAGLLLLRFAGGFVSRAVVSVFGAPWESLGIGLLFLIVVPIASILLLFTFIGYYIAFLVMALYVLLIAVSLIVAALTVGRFIYRFINKQDAEGVNWKSLVIGVVVWSLLGLIPVVGWILMLIIFLLAFGSVVRQVWNRRAPTAQ